MGVSMWWLELIGGGLGLMGNIAEGREQQWQYEREAQVAAQNAQVARQTGAYEAFRQQREAQRVIGGATAEYGASGISMDSVNVLDVLKQAHINSELDRQAILYQSELNARQYEQDARAARYGASAANRNMVLKTITGLVGSGGRALNKAPSGSDNWVDNRNIGGGGNNFSKSFSDGNLRADSRIV